MNRMMGKSPDVQFRIWFSTWNVESMSRKRGEISETQKRSCVNICFAGSKVERAKAEMIGIILNLFGVRLQSRKRCGCNNCQLVNWEGCGS